MTARIIVMPLILSKGLEFDAVLVCDFLKGYQKKNQADQIEETAHLAAGMYLACTRALHELYFMEEQGLPEGLQDCKEYFRFMTE